MAIPVFPETKVALKGRKGLVVGIDNDQSIGHALMAAFSVFRLGDINERGYDSNADRSLSSCSLRKN
jgi:hypothetical protein